MKEFEKYFVKLPYSMKVIVLLNKMISQNFC